MLISIIYYSLIDHLRLKVFGRNKKTEERRISKTLNFYTQTQINNKKLKN